MKVKTSLKAGQFVESAAQQARQVTGLGTSFLQSALSQAGVNTDQATMLAQMSGVDVNRAGAFLQSFGLPAGG